MKEAQRNAHRAEMMEKEKATHGSWRDEIDDDEEDLLRKDQKERSSVNYRTRNDSPSKRVCIFFCA